MSQNPGNSLEGHAERAGGEEAFDATAKPIWDVAAEIAASVPDEEWAKVPADLSANLDHYLYGAPKEER